MFIQQKSRQFWPSLAADWRRKGLLAMALRGLYRGDAILSRERRLANDCLSGAGGEATKVEGLCE